jgi:hypothetical protein
MSLNESFRKNFITIVLLINEMNNLNTYFNIYQISFKLQRKVLNIVISLV